MVKGICDIFAVKAYSRGRWLGSVVAVELNRTGDWGHSSNERRKQYCHQDQAPKPFGRILMKVLAQEYQAALMGEVRKPGKIDNHLPVS
jgi:hypothetical protein